VCSTYMKEVVSLREVWTALARRYVSDMSERDACTSAGIGLFWPSQVLRQIYIICSIHDAKPHQRLSDTGPTFCQKKKVAVRNLQPYLLRSAHQRGCRHGLMNKR
jgi:hypothetical protein